MFGRLSGNRFHFLLGLLIACFVVNSAKAQDTPPCDAGFRTFEHVLGVSCIPEHAQRVVVLDTGELDNALALAAPIVGAPITDAQQYQAYLSDQLEGIADIGGVSEPNLEAILALDPDLILGSKQRHEAVYEQLSAIAPTVFTESLRVPWQQNFQIHADSLGKTAEAEQLLTDYDTHIANLQAALGDALDTLTISIIRFRPGQVRLYLKSSYIGYILQDVGLKRPASQDQDTFSAEISIEQLQDVDADYVFVTGYDVDDSERDTFLNSPLWQTLSAVQNEHVVDVNDDTWIAGLGIQAANLVLDDLETLLIDAEAQATMICEARFRLFEDENLVAPVCVPETAERIVTLDPFYSLQMSLEMDLPVIGAAAYAAEGGFPDNLSADDVAGIELIGGFEAPNLEAITALNPDLIIGDAYFHAAQYDLFNAIAPTVLINTGDWKAWYHLIAEAVGVPERAEAAFDAYNARIADLQALLPEGVTVSFLRVVPDGFQLYREAPNAYAPVAVMSEAGVIRPAFESGTDEESFARLDYEGLANIEGDILLYVVGGSSDDGGQLEAETLGNPIWQALPAVQAEQAYRVDAGPWMSFGGLDSAHAVLDDLFRYVADIEPQEVSPNPFAAVESLATPEATTNP